MLKTKLNDEIYIITTAGFLRDLFSAVARANEVRGHQPKVGEH